MSLNSARASGCIIAQLSAGMQATGRPHNSNTWGGAPRLVYVAHVETEVPYYGYLLYYLCTRMYVWYVGREDGGGVSNAPSMMCRSRRACADIDKHFNGLQACDGMLYLYITPQPPAAGYRT
jgi:hypothetical protein